MERLLTKHNVCLYIKDEEHLDEMREFLISKGEYISKDLFCLTDDEENYLQSFNKGWELNISYDSTEVTTEQFKELFI